MRGVAMASQIASTRASSYKLYGINEAVFNLQTHYMPTHRLENKLSQEVWTVMRDEIKGGKNVLFP